MRARDFMDACDKAADLVAVPTTSGTGSEVTPNMAIIDANLVMDMPKPLTAAAFDDRCTGANPRFPLISEIKQLLLDSYYGRAYVEPSLRESAQAPVRLATDRKKPEAAE